jgi:hypothetical protein
MPAADAPLAAAGHLRTKPVMGSEGDDMLSIEQRVQNGATFLDANVVGWVDKINLKTLNIASSCKCVVGQVTGKAYHEGVRSLGLGHPLDGRGYERANMGFQFGDADSIIRDNGNLTAAWKALILARRALPDTLHIGDVELTAAEESRCNAEYARRFDVTPPVLHDAGTDRLIAELA